MTDFSSLLNPEQFAAATAPDGPLLILAAAGTGKTRTLVYRVAHLLDRGVRPWNILLLTFTNRAAREMLERAEQVVGPDAHEVWGGTFHSIANRILRRNARLLDYPQDFRILDGDEQKGLVGAAIKSLGFKAKDFVKKDVVMGLISGARNRKLDFAEYLEPRAKELDASLDDLLRVERLYTERKLALKAMDFDDLLVNVLRLFHEHPDVLADYQMRFHHVLVDEYQDTNILQSEFVELLAKGHDNLTVVGDDFQCIYTWRGADFRNIMDFTRRHPAARVIKLERNYRSYGGILDLANACILHNPEQYPKTLRPTRESPSGGYRPGLVEVYNDSEQTDAIVQRVQAAHRGGRRWSDIAVLYRSHFQSIQIQIALARMGVPHYTTSGTGVFELAHSKDLLAFFRLAEGQADPLSFVRLLTMMRGMGESSVERIAAKLGGNLNLREPAVRAALRQALPERFRALWDGMDRLFADYAGSVAESVPTASGSPVAESVPSASESVPSAPAPEQAALFGESVPSLSDESVPSSGKSVPSAFGESVPTALGSPLTPMAATERFLDVYYRDYLRRTYDPDNAEDRENDVKELAIQIGRARDVRSFLAEVTLLTNVDLAGEAARGGETPDRITLSTIHQAKGLEWPVVLIPWAVDGMFPSSKSLAAEGDAEEGDESGAAGLAEERRLFYVAVTRARDSLTLFTPQTRMMYDGGVIPCEPSRFIREVPEGLFESVRQYGGGYGGRLSAYGGGRSGGYGGGGYHGSGYRGRFSGGNVPGGQTGGGLRGGRNRFSYGGGR